MKLLPSLIEDYQTVAIERVTCYLENNEKSFYYIVSIESPSNPDILCAYIHLTEEVMDQYDLKMWNNEPWRDWVDE